MLDRCRVLAPFALIDPVGRRGSGEGRNWRESVGVGRAAAAVSVSEATEGLKRTSGDDPETTRLRSWRRSSPELRWVGPAGAEIGRRQPVAFLSV